MLQYHQYQEQQKRHFRFKQSLVNNNQFNAKIAPKFIFFAK